jgi:hypothetical protein
VEIMLNTKLVSELMEKGDFSGVREAMEKSMAEGSQTFEEDLARLIMRNRIDRKEGLAYADSPTNLMWRLQNDFSPGRQRSQGQKEAQNDTPRTTTNLRSPKSCSTSSPPDPVSPAFSDVPHPAPGRTAHLPPLRHARGRRLPRPARGSAWHRWALSANAWTAAPTAFVSAICGQKGLQPIHSKRKQLLKQ